MEDHILQKAKERIAEADKLGPVHIHILMGYWFGSDDPTASSDTPGQCSKCGKPVVTAAVNIAILQLTKDRPTKYRPALLCPDCLKSWLVRSLPASLPQN
jgi:hypothetical protein